VIHGVVCRLRHSAGGAAGEVVEERGRRGRAVGVLTAVGRVGCTAADDVRGGAEQRAGGRYSGSTTATAAAMSVSKSSLVGHASSR
jgi:hypothetical protein